MSRDELVFTVNGNSATAVLPITLSQAGFREREHLQEWVLANPEILGDDVRVVTSEFDQWFSKEGKDPDRLDILGLGADGRLVVAELKRGPAPDLVTMQAINYASRASRFEVEMLADAYIAFHRGTPHAVATSEEARDLLLEHAPDLSADTLRNPRIVIIASDFSPKVTSAAVWLSERGLDITLTRVQAYSMAEAFVVTVSQVWPVPKAEDFVVAPSRRANATAVQATAEVDWTRGDLQRLADLPASLTVLTLMDLCATTPDEWVGGDAVYTASGRQPGKHRGELAGFGNTLKVRFGRGNPPWSWEYAVGDIAQQYYSVDTVTADEWRTVRGLNQSAARDATDVDS